MSADCTSCSSSTGVSFCSPHVNQPASPVDTDPSTASFAPVTDATCAVSTVDELRAFASRFYAAQPQAVPVLPTKSNTKASTLPSSSRSHASDYAAAVRQVQRRQQQRTACGTVTIEHSISKDDLAAAEIMGQWDRKFIIARAGDLMYV